MSSSTVAHKVLIISDKHLFIYFEKNMFNFSVARASTISLSPLKRSKYLMGM